VEEAGPSLRWATAKPERASKSSSRAGKGGQVDDEPPY
jgi:hypothetical protein